MPFVKGNTLWKLAKKGHPQTKETREKISKNNAKYWLGKKRPGIGRNKNLKKGESNGMWKGDNVGYPALHVWLAKNYGKPNKCDFCGVLPKQNGQKIHNIHWANKRGIYNRDKNEWIMLCGSCHKKYDRKRRK